MRIDPSINQAPLSGVRPPLPPLVRERVADSGAEVRPAESFVATQATAASAVPEHAPPANNGVVEQVATSLVPGGPAFQPLGQMKSGPLEPETRTLDFPAGGSPDAIMHETGHLTTDAARPVMGGMLGALLGSYTDTADLEAALDKMRLAGDAMQRLQTLESGYTAAHMQRAGALAGQLADAAAGSAREVSINERFALAHASMIYDVGKLEVDEALLTKPGKLTDEERLAVNKQVEPSEELLGLFNPSAETRAIIRHHHERWDGKGFPSGLAANDIPVPARMVAITDSWDAMTCDRPFRPAMSYDKARGIIESGAGTQYDPELVKLFFDRVAPRPS